MASFQDSGSRRGFLKDIAAGCTAAGVSAAAATPPPNILYLHSHDSGRYLAPYGYAVPTPNLKRLAREGVLFRRAFSAAPTCSPSRAALLTGEFPHQTGMLGLAHRGFSLSNPNRHIVNTLRRRGYHSVLAGLQHVAHNPATLGYDEVYKPKSTRVPDVVPGAVDFLNRRPTQPFFLDVGFFETHREYPAPTRDDDPRYIQPPVPIPDTPATRADMAGYHSSARILDDGVGQILAALDRNQLTANTLIISTTDHGLAFPAMKCNLTDFGFGVSLILRGPTPVRPGTVCDAMVSHLDIYPTLCELAGVDKPSWLQGRSLLPLLRGEAKEINEEVFAEVTYHASYEPKRAVRTQRWKYIRQYGNRTLPVLPNCDDSPSKSLWLEHGWRQHAVAREQLYDLIFDPGEHRNLAADASSSEALKDMRGRLDAWMTRTRDPLLQGPVPAPPRAKVNPVDGTSPREPVVDASADPPR